MAKTRKKTTSTKRSRNITKDRLKGTPFSTAEKLKKAQVEVLEDTWRRLEKARTKKELTQKEEYRFFTETFRKGIVCKYGEKDDSLVRVSLADDSSIKISISEEMRSKENSENLRLLGVLIESMSSSFLTNYLKVMDIVEEDTEIEEQLHRLKNKAQKSM